jgi:methionyl-tRNA formyltransferase
MKVLILSPYAEGLEPALGASSDQYKVISDPVTLQYCVEEQFDFLVCYGYRYILQKELLSLFPGRAINLHISLLPYCRGAHPVLWSILEGKPLGVTIHLLDEGLDTGNILFQQVTPRSLDKVETFSTLYSKMRISIELLFAHNWKYLRTGECSGWRQQGLATLHRARELQDWLHCMPQYWETHISDFCKMAGVAHPLVLFDQL